MIVQNLHMHSLYDDGKAGPKAMLEACVEAGMTSAGISLHSPLPFVNSWSAKEEAPFLSEMRALKRAFAGRLTVYAGLEWDLLSRRSFDGYDYVIGSAHYMQVGGVRCSIDGGEERTRTWLRDVFTGDADAAARAYFAEVGKLAKVPEVDIIGHFDLLTKFNEQVHFFDTQSHVYRLSSLDALEHVVQAGKIVEINTGAISRGHRTTPYPSPQLLRALREMGGRVTFAADAHRPQDVAFGFEDAADLARACGFREYWVLGEEGAFVQVDL